MVVGVPNVGKSTFINGLCGSAVTQTADRPGVTRVQRWVKAGPFLELLDTPGLLWPRLEDPTAARRLAYLGTIRDEILDQETLAAALLAELMAVKPDVVAQRYKISDASDVNALLENACRGRGFLRSGGVPDTARGAAIVLDEFRGGKLGRVTLEMP
jgi:ribosome biogenesis GTPase A